MSTSTRFIVFFVCLLTASFSQSADTDFSLRLQVDLQKDIGQNFGTLFEAVDAEGNVVAGAGYVGSYNTQSRSDRRNLHFFVKSQGKTTFDPQPLPHPTDNAGTYLYEFNDQLYSKVRGGLDRRLRVWDAAGKQWITKGETAPFNVSVGSGVLSSDAVGISYDGQTVLSIQPFQGALAERYYANGQLVFRRHDAQADPPVNELVACPWTTDSTEPVSLANGKTIAMGTPREFVYAYGQIKDQVVAATNTGGLYVFDGQTWKTILEPDTKVSFQIYTIINYGDRLLMGQYPTGELFSYDGEKFEHLPDWPPAIPGVRKSAREAQSLTIYGGDLYCGVWPWGEVWRYSSPATGWQFEGRMFTHPEPTDETTHPYENETIKLGSVLNRWGQRVTSLVPLGDSMFISTSSKGGNKYEPKFKFLAGGKWKDYGAVYQLRRPGTLVVQTDWTEGPTSFEFRISGDQMTVMQDGKLLGTAQLPDKSVGALAEAKLTTGQGTFGPLRGKIISQSSTIASKSNKAVPFVGAYLDMHLCFDRGSDQVSARRSIDDHLQRFQESGLNAIMPKCTTSSGKANYPSQVVAEHTFADWDPLEYFVDRARQLDLSVWPVACVLVCGHDQPRGILRQHPEWAMRNLDGEPIGYISPGHPEARKWIVSMLEEIVLKTQADGLVLDYLRYHNRPIQLDAYSAAQFEKELSQAGKLTEDERAEKLQAFRERLLTELMADINTALRKAKPDLKIAVYSWGPHILENHRVAQDWQTWVERGYLDMINISGYLYPEKNGDDYLAKLEEKLRTSKSIVAATGKQIPVTFALGVRTSHGEVRSADQIAEILQAASRAKADGVAFFTWAYLQPWLEDVNAAGSLTAFKSGE